MRELAAHPRVIETLEFLYGREPFSFQTLSFLVGTRQPTHRDLIHFSSVPALFMAGVWVPVEDVDEERGALCTYPGSHRLPEVQLATLCLAAEDNQTKLGENYLVYEDYVRATIEKLANGNAHIKHGVRHAGAVWSRTKRHMKA